MTRQQEAAIRSAFAALADALIDALRTHGRPPGPPRLLTMAEAGDLLSISRATTYQELAAGRLRTIKVGRRRLVPATAIEEYIEKATKGW